MTARLTWFFHVTKKEAEPMEYHSCDYRLPQSHLSSLNNDTNPDELFENLGFWRISNQIFQNDKRSEECPMDECLSYT